MDGMFEPPRPMRNSGDGPGRALPRVDGLAKVTGSASYAGDFAQPGMLYGVVVSSRIARGRVTGYDLDAALAMPGVRRIYTCLDRPRMPASASRWHDMVAPPGRPMRPLYDERVLYAGQPVALVIADTFESARDAATRVQVRYEAEAHATRMERYLDQAYVPPKKREGIPPPAEPRGDADRAFAEADRKIVGDYATPAEYHNPIELFGSLAWWEGGKLCVFDKTQGAAATQQYLASVFGLGADRVQVISPFVGGAFGSALRPQYQLFLAAMAARDLAAPVRVQLTRTQMFSLGYRPRTLQRVGIATNASGSISAITHHAIAATSTFEDYQEAVVNWSGKLYACDNVRTGYELVKLDLFSPQDTRAPGAALGLFALEAAIDEIAHVRGMDPVAFRLANDSDRDQDMDLPYTSKALRSALTQGTAAFGWQARSPTPRGSHDGHTLIGHGMASGIWDAMQMQASASATLRSDGRIEVGSATADMGTGMYTVMVQVAAHVLGLPASRIVARLGDSSLPEAPLAGGSWSAASVGAAVENAALALARKLHELAVGLADSPLAGTGFEAVEFEDGAIRLRAHPDRAIRFETLLAASGGQPIGAIGKAAPDKASQKRWARNTHGAQFVEVGVDEELGVVQVRRVVAAVAAGRIINPLTARSQIIGGVVMGIGMALHEEAMLDDRLGRMVNRNLGEYHIPAHADIPPIEVIFVDEPDPEVNQLGVKGLGEIGIVGTAAAVANAIFNATGKRVRDLPITLDKLL